MTEVSRCSKCGRPLRDAESIARGMGPVCAGKKGKRRGNVGGAGKGASVAVGGLDDLDQGEAPIAHGVAHDRDEEKGYQE